MENTRHGTRIRLPSRRTEVMQQYDRHSRRNCKMFSLSSRLWHIYTVSKTKHLAFDDLSTRRLTSKFTVRFLKGRHMTSVSNTGVILDTRVRRPCSRASVHTGVNTARWYSLWTRECVPRPVNTAWFTGASFDRPAPVSTTIVFANTARGHGCSVHTTRVHGP